MKKIYLFANWKMYLNLRESQELAGDFTRLAVKMSPSVEMAVFPSALAWASIRDVLNLADIRLGAQNVYWVDKGGYTGEISAAMYKEAGCHYALVGHSERRHQFNESNSEVRKKMEAVLTAGLTPVLCVGETDQERADGMSEQIVRRQVARALTDLDWSFDHELFIAYEPVWAISKSGVGVACDAREAERMHAVIKKEVNAILPNVKPIILYGGSVRPENIAEYLSSSLVDGVLVGGASVKSDSWQSMVKISSQVNID
ncbi:MAG: triose-phosphate isomerase [Candidatus Magasanikbacteria bacterium CG10_big_fil_rev_8_21_14_0_10_40_10]|uniref:Triosephosphate isomerase n=1 Tax=Candidatus Magasanikbacteria bacterium CG10_big_fil_rev_8_21_14_0_10_40_10 TaxID=1974648 RepID=A0A2M6W324_9BACT|nr:MAG: triose-phosphate isomerase [Candidatus Magasanikbacteria bacterium CG10_big_fil_rev_8_21_14_0_10_40_10]